MHVDKIILHKIIEEELTTLLQNTTEAAQQAHETATHEGNKAENKYDTLGLEAAYLAAGQSKRVAELEHKLQAFKKLKVRDFTEDMPIGIGALVSLNTMENDKKYVFLSPVSGGLEIEFNKIKLMLISESSPLGKALKNSFIGDDILIRQAHHELNYEISGLW